MDRYLPRCGVYLPLGALDRTDSQQMLVCDDRDKPERGAGYDMGSLVIARGDFKRDVLRWRE